MTRTIFLAGELPNELARYTRDELRNVAKILSKSQLQLPPQLQKFKTSLSDLEISWVNATHCTELRVIKIKDTVDISLALPRAPCLLKLNLCNIYFLTMDVGELTFNSLEKLTLDWNTILKLQRRGSWFIRSSTSKGVPHLSKETAYLNLSTCRKFKKLRIKGTESGSRVLFVTFPPGNGSVVLERDWKIPPKSTERQKIQLRPTGSITATIQMNYDSGSTTRPTNKNRDERSSTCVVS